MARYIDADRLNKEILASWEKDKHCTIEASAIHNQEHIHLMRIIEKQPTTDVAEVKHGEWIHEPPYTTLNGRYLKASECSNCHAFFVSNGNEPYSDHPYCCECGAKNGW